jgi:hypothetical protein
MDSGAPAAKNSALWGARAAECGVSRSILSYGVRIGIRTNRDDLMDRVVRLFPPLWKPASGSSVDRVFSLLVRGTGSRGPGNSSHVLFQDDDLGVRSPSLNTILEVLERRIKLYVAETARRRVFVHAGVVGWHGRAIIVPGASMSGKTSLVAELVRAGATYYSDEYAVLDLGGRVHPYPQPLAIRRPGSSLQKKRQAEDLGGVVGSKPLPVGLVVASRYEKGGRWRPERQSVGQAVLELLQNTIPARRNPEVVIQSLKSAVSTAIFLKGMRGEARETARLILEEVEKRGAPVDYFWSPANLTAH